MYSQEFDFLEEPAIPEKSINLVLSRQSGTNPIELL
jgi:hypothetical protein